ncbi:hypothetical protein [Anaerobacillus sp. 1_MG-2023]|uniref:hypothetical protein n=1 Tax=Anaerobacillus sp. 1_MG-2023 TaxID=3062655 RepID=UPI0026E4936C|nr:hypothetical protein [Anaerobacillus sp. 1_MG-2023]MDO6657834.1 hypothetical protein [Anaerobacillus sp. 1_MG-2023]
MPRFLSILTFCLLISGCAFNEETEADPSTKQQPKKTEKIVTDNNDKFGTALLKAVFKDGEVEIESKEMGSLKDSQSALEDNVINVMTGVPDEEKYSDSDVSFEMTYSYYYDDKEQGYWVYLVKGEDEKLLKLLNEKLLKAREDGTYQKIYDQFYKEENHSILIDHDKEEDQDKKEATSDTTESKPSSTKQKTTSQDPPAKEEQKEKVQNPVSINPSGVEVVNGQFSVEGITLGMTLEQVKNKLGTPTYEGSDRDEMQSHDHVTEYGPLYIGYYNNSVKSIIFEVSSGVKSTGWFSQLSNQTTEGDGNYYYIEGSKNYFKVEPSDQPAYAYVMYTGPEFESEKDRKERESNKMSPEEAIEAVIEHENIADHPELIVEHDHDEGERYVIHVYELVDEGTEAAHTATWGWYYVDPYSGTIESIF